MHCPVGVAAGMPPAASRRCRRLHQPQKAFAGGLLLRRKRCDGSTVFRQRRSLPRRRRVDRVCKPLLWRRTRPVQRLSERHRDT